jgi:hypothetical protein
LIEHNRNILDARTTLFKDYADGHFMTIYGDVSQPLLDLLKAHAVGFKWFTFFQGLEPSAAMPSPMAPQEQTVSPGQATREFEHPPHARVPRVGAVAVHHRARAGDDADLVLTAILHRRPRDAGALADRLVHPHRAGRRPLGSRARSARWSPAW